MVHSASVAVKTDNIDGSGIDTILRNQPADRLSVIAGQFLGHGLGIGVARRVASENGAQSVPERSLIGNAERRAETVNPFAIGP